MNTVKILTGIIAASLAVSGCLNDPQVAVHASFTTEKDVYERNVWGISKGIKIR